VAEVATAAMAVLHAAAVAPAPALADGGPHNLLCALLALTQCGFAHFRRTFMRHLYAHVV